jgi:UDP-glucose 4-epimerase
MTFWITGVGGFIGRYLAPVLASAGHGVYGLGNGGVDGSEAFAGSLQACVDGEVSFVNLDALRSAGGLPTTCFHLAGGSSVGLSIAQPYEDFCRTVSSTAILLEWLRSHAPECRVVVASSAAVYGAAQNGPIPESAATMPMSPYGVHKLIMEQQCRSYAQTYGTNVTVARLFSVYGPHLSKQLPWELCKRIQAGERTVILGGSGGELRDWTDVRDVTRLLLKIAEQPQRGQFKVINCGSGKGTTVADFAGMLIDHWQSKIEVQFSGVSREGDPFSLISDDEYARALGFDWQIPIVRGIADYAAWFKDPAR